MSWLGRVGMSPVPEQPLAGRLVDHEHHLLVRSQAMGMKGAQFFLYQRIERDGVLLCEAKFDAVCIGFDGRPRRLPKALIDVINRSGPDKNEPSVPDRS